MTSGKTRIDRWLRIACAVLLLSLGFAHKPVQASSYDNPASAHYVLPDGTYASLCIEDASHGQPHKSWLGSGCDLCRLSGAVLLPSAPADFLPASGSFTTAFFSASPSGVGTQPDRPGSPVRGPPSIFA
jgi:hypothetical protein